MIATSDWNEWLKGVTATTDCADWLLPVIEMIDWKPLGVAVQWEFAVAVVLYS